MIGARLLGELTYVWERSAGESPSDYSVLAETSEPSYNDETAPADGSTRWYQATIVTEDGRGFAASADEGNLSAGLPGVRTEESVYTSGSSAILRGALESLGEPSATDYGFCIGTNPNPTLDAGSDATCVSLGTPAGTGDFSTTVTDLELGRQLYVRAFAVNAAGEAYGGSVLLLTTPPVPGFVAASDGEVEGAVDIEWEEVAGATSYVIRRDGAQIDVVATSPYRDFGADAPPAPTNTNLNASATQGTRSDAVVLTWSEPDLLDGGSHTYSVIAQNTSGSTPGVVSDQGYAGAYPVAGYEIRRAGGPWEFVGEATSFEDADAPSPSVNVGTASASDGTFEDFVRLNLTGLTTANGASRNYFVRAKNDTGAGSPSPVFSGYRGAAAFVSQWERSASSTPNAFASISGAVSEFFDDPGAPSDGAIRYYRVRLDTDLGDGTESFYSTIDAGNRAAAPLAITGTVTFDTDPLRPTFRGEFEGVGSPAATSVGFCWSFAGDDPTVASDQIDCLSLTAPSSVQPFTAQMTGTVQLVTDYRVVAFAESSLGRYYSDVVLDFQSRNTCGGVGGNDFLEGEACGPCSLDVLACDASDQLVCNGATEFSGYNDNDGDNYGALGATLETRCEPEFLAPEAGDCDDFDPDVNPGQPDKPDDLAQDTNCDGIDGDVARSLFVSTLGDDSNDGTRENPYRTISAAMAALDLAGGVDTVLVADGDYEEQVTLIDGASMYGRYSGDFLARAENRYPAILSPTAIGLLVDGYTSTGEVEGFAVVASEGAPLSGADASSRALVARNVTGSLLVRNCALEADNGAIGPDAVSAADGADGSNGLAGGGRA